MKRLIAAIAACTMGVVACSESPTVVGGQGGSASGNKGGSSNTSTSSTNKGGGSNSNGGSSQSSSTTKSDTSSGGTSSDSSSSTKQSSNAGGSSSSSTNGSKATGGSTSSSSTKAAGGSSTTSNTSAGGASNTSTTKAAGGASTTSNTSAGGTSSTSAGGSSATSGGAAPTGGSGVVSTEPLGGYHVQGDWAGFAFTFADGGATITPDKATGFKTMVDKDGPYCVKGTVDGTEKYTSIAAVGINTKQEKVADAPTGKIATTSTGILLNLTNNDKTVEALRVQIEDGTDPTAADAAKHRWCVNISDFGKDVTIPWASFNTECWSGGEGTAFDPKTELAKVIVYVPDNGKTKQTFDFCVNKIGPADVKGRGTGSIVSDCGNNVSWSQSTVTDNYGNITGGSYRFQANGWNMNGGSATYQMLSSCGFKVSSQPCTQSSTEGKPCSFPSIYIGTSADDKVASGNGLPKQVSAITSAPTCLGWTAASNANDEYNVSYDVWLSDSSGGHQVAVYLMLWFHKPPKAVPGGDPVADGVTIGSQPWTVWWGDNGMGTNVVSYVAPSDLAPGKAYSFNLKDFLDDAVERGYVKKTHYLIAVMGGTEIWGGAAGASISSFKASAQ